MKKISLSMLLSFALMSAFALEGYVLQFKLTVTGKETMTGDLKMYTSPEKGGRAEIDMHSPNIPAGMGHMVSLSKTDEPDVIYMLNEPAKTYTKMDISARNKSQKAAQGKVEIIVVGNETINGYKCTHVKIKEDGKEREMWTSKDVVEYQKYAQLKGSKYMVEDHVWAQLKAKGADGFPVRMVMDERGGRMQMDLVKATKQGMTAAFFEIPSDYKESAGMGMGGGQTGGLNIQELQKKLQDATPEEREKIMKEIQQQYGSKPH